MKINPPASSSSPTSRKKPRIMRHLMSLAPENAVSHLWHRAGNSTSSASYQRLPSGLPGFGAPESVDAAICALYKTANGGGRNPAAAVLWAAPSRERFMLRAWLSQEHPEI